MTNEQACTVLAKYHEHLGTLGVLAAGDGPPLELARYMCRYLPVAAAELRDAFASERAPFAAIHCLGFVQGVLYVEKVYTFEEMQAHNEEARGA